MADTLEAKARAMLLTLASSTSSPPSLKARIARKQAELDKPVVVVAAKSTADQRSNVPAAPSRRSSESSNVGADLLRFKLTQGTQYAAHLSASEAQPSSPADPRPLQYSFARSGASQPSSPDFSQGRLQQSMAADPRMLSFVSDIRSPVLSRTRPGGSTVMSSSSVGVASPDARLADIRRRSQLAQSHLTRSPADSQYRRHSASDPSTSRGHTVGAEAQPPMGQPQQASHPAPASSPVHQRQRQRRTLDLDSDVSPQELRRASALAARAAAAQSVGRSPLGELSQASGNRGRGGGGTGSPGVGGARQAAMHGWTSQEKSSISMRPATATSPPSRTQAGRTPSAVEMSATALRAARVLNVDEGEMFGEEEEEEAPAAARQADEPAEQAMQGVAIHIRLSSPTRSPSGMRRRDLSPQQHRLLEVVGEGQEGTVQPQPQGMKARELSPEQRRHVQVLATAEELDGGILPARGGELTGSPSPSRSPGRGSGLAQGHPSSTSDIAALAQQISGLRDQLAQLLDKQRHDQQQQQQQQQGLVGASPAHGAATSSSTVLLPGVTVQESDASLAILSPDDPTYMATIAAVAAAIDAAEALLPADSEAVLKAGRRAAEQAQAELAQQAGEAVDMLHRMRSREGATSTQNDALSTPLDMAAEELSALAAPGGPLYAALFDPSDPHALVNVLGPEVMAAAVPAATAADPPAAPTQVPPPSAAPSARLPLPVPASLTHAVLEAERAEAVSLAQQLEAELQAARQERELYNAKVAANLAQGVANGAPLDGGARAASAIPSTSQSAPLPAQGVAPLPLSPDELYRQFMGALDALDSMETAASQLEQLRADAAEAEAQKQSLALATEWQQQSEAAMVAAQLSALADQAGQEGARVAGQYAQAMENAYAGYANTQAELLAALVSNVQAVEKEAGRPAQDGAVAGSRPIIVPDRTAVTSDYHDALTRQPPTHSIPPTEQESVLSVSTEGGLEHSPPGQGQAADAAAQLLQSYASDLKRRMDAEMGMIDTASKAAKAKLRAEVDRIQGLSSSSTPPEPSVLSRAKYTAVTKYKAERARLAGKKAQVHQKYYEELLRFRRTAKSVSRAQRAGSLVRAGEGAALDSSSLDGSLLSLGAADPLLSTSTDSSPGFEMPVPAASTLPLAPTQDMLSSMMSNAASSFVDALTRSMLTAGLQVAGIAPVQQPGASAGLPDTLVDHGPLGSVGRSMPMPVHPNSLVTGMQVQEGPIVEDGQNVIIVSQVGEVSSRNSTPSGMGLDSGPGVVLAEDAGEDAAVPSSSTDRARRVADRLSDEMLHTMVDKAVREFAVRGLVPSSSSSSSSGGEASGSDVLEVEEGDMLETSGSLVALPFAAPKPAMDAVRPKAAPAVSTAARRDSSSISPRSPLSPGRTVGGLSPPLSKGRDEGFPTTSPDSTGPMHPLATAGVSSEEEDDLYDIEPPSTAFSSLALLPAAGRLSVGMGQATASPVLSPTRTIRRAELTPREQWHALATSFLQDVLSELGEEGLLDALVNAATGSAPIISRACLRAVELRYEGRGEGSADCLNADTRALLFDVWNEDIERMAHLKGIALQAQEGQGLAQHPVLLDLASRLKGILSSRVAAMSQTWDADPTKGGQAGDKERAAVLLKADALARAAVKQTKTGRLGTDMLTLYAEQDRGASRPMPGSPNTVANMVTDALLEQLLQEALREEE